MGQALRHRFSASGEAVCAHELRPFAAKCAQKCAQTWGHSSGGVDWPKPFLPQHSTLPEVVTPQVW